MQSLARQLKRGNAIVRFNSVFKQFEVKLKKGHRKGWLSSRGILDPQRSTDQESLIIAQTTKPLTRGQMGSHKRHLFLN